MGRYSGEKLEWFRIFTLWPKPKRVWSREQLTYDGRRDTLGAEQASLYPDHVVIRCASRAGERGAGDEPGLTDRFPGLARGQAARRRLEPLIDRVADDTLTLGPLARIVTIMFGAQEPVIRPVSRVSQRPWVAGLLMAAALALVGCGDDAPPRGDGAAEESPSQAPTSASASASADAEATTPTADPRLNIDGDPLLIETHSPELGSGDVLDRSFLGDRAFCPGGTFTDEHGSYEEGLVQKTFQCGKDQLTIGFSPQQRSFIQSCRWHVVEGTGRFAGLQGEGWMVARYEEDSAEGTETFVGTVVLSEG